MTADAFVKSSLGEMAYGICVLSAQVADLSQRLAAAEAENAKLKEAAEPKKGAAK